MTDKYLTMNETEEQTTQRRTREILMGAVRSCVSAVAAVKQLCRDRGGRDAYLAELGDDAAQLSSAAETVKAFVETVSDLSLDITLPEAPE